jgi:2-amino-4-hydroxy-6-hydroxymethyldihydropteridine diphosphokinase
MQTEQLTLPHLAFRDRDFVLKPLTDLNPELTDPISGQTVSQLLAGLGSDQKSIISEVDQKA